MNSINHVKANICVTNGKGTVLMSEIKRQGSKDTLRHDGRSRGRSGCVWGVKQGGLFFLKPSQ